MDELKRLGITELHLWLNDNRVLSSCEVFDYRGLNGHWKPDELRFAVSELKASGISSVFTPSPLLQTTDFIESLSRPNGPLALAAELGGAPIEFDLEGNWTEKARKRAVLQSCKTMPTTQAAQQLTQNIRRLTPNSKIIIGTTTAHMKAHEQFLNEADEISPQLYGAQFAHKLTDMRRQLAVFERKYPGKMLKPALSIECSPSHARTYGCNQERFAAGLKIVADKAACIEARVNGVVVWAHNEMKTSCRRQEGDGVCSTFGRSYLESASSRIVGICSK